MLLQFDCSFKIEAIRSCPNIDKKLQKTNQKFSFLGDGKTYSNAIILVQQ